MHWRSIFTHFQREYGYGNYIDHSDGKLYPTSEFDDHSEIRKIIDDYDEETFWEELFYRLVDRDIERAGDVRHKREHESVEDWVARARPFYEKWGNEIDEHGVNRLKIED